MYGIGIERPAGEDASVLRAIQADERDAEADHERPRAADPRRRVGGALAESVIVALELRVEVLGEDQALAGLARDVGLDRRERSRAPARGAIRRSRRAPRSGTCRQMQSAPVPDVGKLLGDARRDLMADGGRADT